jgi:hypothetical protein
LTPLPLKGPTEAITRNAKAMFLKRRIYHLMSEVAEDPGHATSGSISVESKISLGRATSTKQIGIGYRCLNVTDKRRTHARRRGCHLL